MTVLTVVIVDDDEWIRRGRRDGLAAFADINVVAALDPHQAHTYDWSGVDTVIVDAHDSRSDWDRYPGIAVVETIRRSRTPEQTTVFVISGHILDPVLRLRMAEAGADFFFAHLDLPTPHDLADALRHPDRARRVEPPNQRELAPYGLRPWSKPNAAIRWAEQEGLSALFTEQGTQKSGTGSRRAMLRARDEIASRAHLDPNIGDRTRRPGDVTWRDVSRFINRALGRKPPL